MSPSLTIVIPTWNEAATIADTLDGLSALREAGVEVLVIDGGSDDDTVARCTDGADRVLQAPRGRAKQLNAGAASARGEALLFLHADTRLPEDAMASIGAALAAGVDWGRFDVEIAGRSVMLPVIATLMNLRSRWTGIATGDQAIFVRRALFESAGGFPDQPLMEDIELSTRLRLRCRPACLRARVVTSGRRWERHGVWRTILLMWSLRWRYWLGTPADTLARSYR
ncbi:MAG: TIGR04283 family arsenosugar biosynthesis glycosyltransferase [Burkholderiaceae bacterium]|nr:TIGR04283 family arsenosugar biosynthesis glycosyltransferase [Burkholderiaceae bacterium]